MLASSYSATVFLIKTKIFYAYLMQGHIGDPEVSLGVDGESVGHVELGLPPCTLRSTHAGELEQRWDLDWSVVLVTIREVKVERTAG
jgi:hypothetical protein